MRFHWSHAFVMATLVTPVCAASYKLIPFRIPGATSIGIAAINDRGNAVGTYTDPTGSYAFIGPSGGVKIINRAPGPYVSEASVPSGVNNSNVVVGEYFDALAGYQAFVWQNGVYTYTYGGTRLFDPYPPSINNSGQITYNTVQGGTLYYAYTGQPAQGTAQLPGLARATGLNSSGQVVGDQYTLTPTGTPTVFLYTAGSSLSLEPPNATGSHGGFVNDSGHVAGEYFDANGKAHAFLYAGGVYTTFDMPANFQIQGIDNRDQVFGSYSDAGHSHAFIYYNGHVTLYGSWPNTYGVAASVSAAGTYVAVTVSSASAPTESYLVQCSGSGC